MTCLGQWSLQLTLPALNHFLLWLTQTHPGGAWNPSTLPAWGGGRLWAIHAPPGSQGPEIRTLPSSLAEEVVGPENWLAPSWLTAAPAAPSCVSAAPDPALSLWGLDPHSPDGAWQALLVPSGAAEGPAHLSPEVGPGCTGGCGARAGVTAK